MEGCRVPRVDEENVEVENGGFALLGLAGEPLLTYCDSESGRGM